MNEKRCDMFKIYRITLKVVFHFYNVSLPRDGRLVRAVSLSAML